MKTIEPVSVWFEGSVKQATKLNASAVHVQLNSWAKFNYQLISDDSVTLSAGTLVMEGADYQNWDQDSFSWEWIAQKLGLIITVDVNN